MGQRAAIAIVVLAVVVPSCRRERSAAPAKRRAAAAAVASKINAGKNAAPRTGLCFPPDIDFAVTGVRARGAAAVDFCARAVNRTGSKADDVKRFARLGVGRLICMTFDTTHRRFSQMTGSVPTRRAARDSPDAARDARVDFDRRKVTFCANAGRPPCKSFTTAYRREVRPHPMMRTGMAANARGSRVAVITMRAHRNPNKVQLWIEAFAVRAARPIGRIRLDDSDAFEATVLVFVDDDVLVARRNVDDDSSAWLVDLKRRRSLLLTRPDGTPMNAMQRALQDLGGGHWALLDTSAGGLAIYSLAAGKRVAYFGLDKRYHAIDADADGTLLSGSMLVAAGSRAVVVSGGRPGAILIGAVGQRAIEVDLPVCGPGVKPIGRR
ncbi:MAG: hypothetical protein KC503_38750 [Myxococcales bacterium]|nr:hypothetical protein [Myxococcales bacterium]